MNIIRIIIIWLLIFILDSTHIVYGQAPPPPEHGIGESVIKTQTLNIAEGWSGISSCILPIYPDVETMFGEIIDDLVILQGQNGFYFPEQFVNTIGDWNINEGYKIKVNGDVELNIIGTPSSNKTISLIAGWNLVPVLGDCNYNPNQVFNSQLITIVKEIAGVNLFWPDLSIYSLGQIEKGKAYYVFAQQPTSITFPECSTSNYQPNRIAPQPIYSNIPWETPFPTSVTHTLAIPNNITAKFDHEIALGGFATNGKCYGISVLSRSNNSITLFGDDLSTEYQDGFKDGEPIEFRLYDFLTGDLFLNTVTYDMHYPQSNGLFYENGLSVLSSLKTESLNISEMVYMRMRVAPNPSSDQIKVFCSCCDAIFTLVDMQGNICRKIEMSKNSITIDVSGLPKGIYSAICKSEMVVQKEKIIIQ